MTRTFAAPWGRQLVVMSVVGTLVLGLPIVAQASRGFWLIPIVLMAILAAITGRFSGSGLGRYHAFVTDPVRTVVVTTQQGIVVVSPDRPDEFAAAVEQLRYPRTP